MAEFTADFSKSDRARRPGGRLDAAVVHRNHQPILDVLKRYLTGVTGDVLEIGSGTGQHVAGFAKAFPGIIWWPSDPLEAHRASIAVWADDARAAGSGNIQAPASLDATRPDWGLGAAPGLPKAPLAGMLCTNVLHIAPFAVAEGLLREAGAHLRPQGRVFIYGPFARDGAHIAESNAAFDKSLRAENPGWGVRDIADIERIGKTHGLSLTEAAAMPANNFTLVLTRNAE